MSLKIIGLCGGSGSGKGAVGNIFSKNGYLTIDTDKVYRDITDNKSKCLDALICEFGAEILNSNATLDRKALGKIVFNDKKKLRMLNDISHAFILQRVREIIKEAESLNYCGVVVDAPLLYESGFHKECDAVVAVIADRDIRIKRIVARDLIDEESAIKRIDSQISDNELSARADYTIVNNEGLAVLEARVTDFIKRFEQE